MRWKSATASHRRVGRLSGVRWVLLVFSATGLAGPGTAAKAQGIDFGELDNVANLTQVTYQGNQFNPSTGVFTTYARVKNTTADREIEAPLLLVIDSFSVSGIIPLNPDGMTPGGRPFYNFSSLLGGDMALAPSEVSGPKQILLRNPARRPFSFQATVWGMPEPVCTNDTQCGDDDPCTDDVCSAGHCVNTNNTASCDDGNACTL